VLCAFLLKGVESRSAIISLTSKLPAYLIIPSSVGRKLPILQLANEDSSLPLLTSYEATGRQSLATSAPWNPCIWNVPVTKRVQQQAEACPQTNFHVGVTHVEKGNVWFLVQSSPWLLLSIHFLQMVGRALKTYTSPALLLIQVLLNWIPGWKVSFWITWTPEVMVSPCPSSGQITWQ
jgi:hypothetical protein